MPSVGTAYVNIRVSTKGFETSLDTLMKRLSTKMEAAGTSLGKDFERGMNKSAPDAIFNKWATASDSAVTKIKKNLQTVGDKMDGTGQRMAVAANGAVQSLKEVGVEADSTTKKVGGLSRASQNASRSLSRIGGRGGGGGLRKAGDDAGFFASKLKELTGEAAQNTKLLRGLYNAAAFGGTALAGAVGGLSAAAQGIFAVGANAAAAAPALGVFASGLLGLAQVGGVVAISMRGVSEALKAGFDVATKTAAATGGASKALQSSTKSAADAARRAVEAARRGVRDAVQGVQDAARAVGDARQALVDAYRDAARAASDAARRTADAERALAAAQRETTAAQVALNLARKEGLEQLEDIAFAAEDAGMAEERAALALFDAQSALAEASELAPDDRARIEAELAFREADLNMRQAVDRREDADKAQRAAAKSGVEGTEAVRGAHEDLADAQQTETDAARDLADARDEEARTAEDNARRIRDAQLGIADAQRGVADAQESLADAQKALADAQKRQGEAAKAASPAMTALAKASDTYNAALKKLSPSQKEFVERILGMRKDYEKFARAVAEPVFAGLLDAMDTIKGSGLVGVIQEGLVGTSEALGDVARDAGKVAASPAFQKSLGDAMASNNEAVRHFGRAGVNLADAFVQVADAAGPLLEDLSEWVETITQGWSDTARAKNETGELGKTMSTAADRVKEFWNLGKELWNTLKLLGGAANTAANDFGDLGRKGQANKDKFGYITTLTDSLKDFNKDLKDDTSLVGGFDQALKNLNAAGRAFKTVIIDPLIAMGQDPDLEKAFDKIAESTAFTSLGETAGDAVPELADLVINIADFLDAISKSGSIDNFLATLSTVAGWMADLAASAEKVELDWLNDLIDGLGDLVGLDIDTQGDSVLKLVGYITGATAAASIMWKVFKIGASPFIAAGKGAGSLVMSIVNLPKTTKTAFNEMKRISSNVFTSIKNGWTNVTNLFKKKPDRKATAAYIPKPPSVAQTKSMAAGTDVAADFAKGLKAGRPLVDQAMEVLERAVRGGLIEIAKSAGPRAVKVGIDIMKGLARGIRTGTAEAKTAAFRAGRSVADDVGDGAGTHSPSTITLKDGNDIMEGLELGIKSGTAEAQLAARTAGAKVGNAVGNSAKTTAATSSAGIGTAMGKGASGSRGMRGLSRAMGPLKLAAKGLGTAMTFAMGPFGIVLELLPLLIPLLIWLEKKTGIFSKALDLLSAAAKWLWDKALKPLFEWLKGIAGDIWDDMVTSFEDAKDTLDTVGDKFKWLWGKIQDLFDWVKENWPTILAIITGPIGLAVLAITKNWDKIKKVVTDAVDNIKAKLKKIWNGITEGWEKVQTFFSNLWPVHIKPKVDKLVDNARKKLKNFFKGIITGWAVIGTWIANLWRTKIKPKIDKLIDNAKKKLKNIWNGIKGGWQSEIVQWLARLWVDKIRPKINGILDNAKKRLRNFFNGIKTAWADIRGWVNDLWPKHIKPWIAGIITAAKAKWEGFFGGLITGLKSVAKTMVGKLNSWLIDPINRALGKFNIGFKIPTIKLPEGLAEGGLVRGPGGPRDDKVVKRLSNNEYVLPANLTKKLGPKNLDYLRKHGTLPPGVGGTGGLWGSVTGTVSAGAHLVTAGIHSLGDAIKRGLSAALSWIVDRAANVLPNNFSGNMVLGLGKQLALAFKPTATRTDAAAAAAAAAAATSHGSGPPAVWRALRSIGLSMVQAAGVMGNMQSESGFDPYIVQGGGRSLNPAAAGNLGYGLVQWTPGSKLIPYLRGKRPSINAEVTALGLQLQGRGPSPEGAAGRLLKAATTIEAAARAFELGYERHAGGPQASRITQARAWYNRFKGSDALGASGSPAAEMYAGAATGWTYAVPRPTHTYNFPGHNPPTALDLGVHVGTPVRAMTGGSIEEVRGSPSSRDSYGYWIILRHANGWQTLYAHMSRILRRSGSVRPGQLIGYSGASGGVSGPHLHLEITKRWGSTQPASTHTRADARGVRWPYRYGGAWAKGGVISPQSDGRGVMALLAEAGKAERITPLDSEGFTPAERRMLEALEMSLGGGGGDTFHVHPSARMNEAHLADMVARRVAWKRRRGAGVR